MIQDTCQVERSAVENKLSVNLRPMLPERTEIGTADPMDLMLNPRRFDIVAKCLYARYRERGLETDWARRLYDEHIRVFNNYHEADESDKRGIEAFLDSFHMMLDEIRRDGYDDSRSRVAVGEGGVPADGSHRIAACALCGVRVPVVRIDKTDNYDAWWFRARGLSAAWADAVAREYCRLNTRAHIVNLYPAVAGREHAVREILRQAGTIYYEKEVYLTNAGPLYYIKQVYEGEPWVGEASSGYRGAQNKADACFRRRGALRVFVLVADSVDRVNEAKDEIRSLYGIGNHSVHISDRHAETRRLAGVLFNDNSIHFLNHVRHRDYARFNRLFDEYKAWLAEHDADVEDFCIDASSVMSVYGIREGRDLDFLHHGDAQVHPEPLIRSHNADAEHYPAAIDDIIYNPGHHFWYDGVKFASLDLVRRMKQARNEEKDRLDVRAIDARLRRSVALMAGVVMTRIGYKYRRKLVRFAGKFRASRRRAFLRPYRNVPDLERRLREEGYFSQYGQDKWITEEMFPGKRDGVFVDIGAHDGVTCSNTLYLEKEHGWTGVAVEPIPHVYEQLRRNRSCVAVHGCVGARGGTTTFRVISGYAEMLSGVVDEYDPRHLERIERELREHGGRFTDIEVPCFTLQSLLESNGLTRIDYLTIDVEGSEHSILRDFDFDRFEIAVIDVENNYKDASLQRLLERHGFMLHSVVGDQFYVSAKAWRPGARG